MRKAQNFPFHPLLLGMYSVAAMLAANISEVRASAAMRPLLVMLAGPVVLLVALRLILKEWQRAGVLASVWVLLFITYGHLYGTLEASPGIGGVLGRHRVLLPLYGALFASSVFFALRRKHPQVELTRVLNIFSLLLLAFPIFQIASSLVTSSRGEREASQWTFSQPMLKPNDPDAMPDVYFIVLDSYTRSDALLEDFGFDNSGFERSLEEMGFYIADSSITNYTFTQGSITTALNLDYVPELRKRLEAGHLEGNPWVLLKESLVRHQLERLGYQTVAFETSYEWSRLKDADIFLGETRSSAAWQQLDPFERMWANSTVLMLMNEIDVMRRASRPVDASVHPYHDHIEKQLFLLENLAGVADNPAPTFTFAHILIPHIPYVFAADGSIRTDPGFFGTKFAGPVDTAYERLGYTGEIAFINSRMETILGEILSRSEIPPIIVVMGDHGSLDSNKPKIFYAVFLPEGAEQVMYPTISPVNTFRIIFDTYFGSNYGRLPDVTRPGDDLR